MIIKSHLTRKLEQIRESLLRDQAAFDGVTAHKVISEDNTLFIFEKRQVGKRCEFL